MFWSRFWCYLLLANSSQPKGCKHPSSVRAAGPSPAAGITSLQEPYYYKQPCFASHGAGQERSRDGAAPVVNFDLIPFLQYWISNLFLETFHFNVDFCDVPLVTPHPFSQKSHPPVFFLKVVILDNGQVNIYRQHLTSQVLPQGPTAPPDFWGILCISSLTQDDLEFLLPLFNNINLKEPCLGK